MTIQQIIDLAKKTELKNAAAVKEDTEAILGYINLGLIELYKRFPLDTEELIITMGLNGNENYPYTMINETVYQMPGNFMYIISAYGEVADQELVTINELPVNEEDNLFSINTISWNKIQIPLVTTGEHISIVYAAAPEYYTLDDLAEELPIPTSLVSALLAYIGWSGYSSIDPARAENTAYYQRFENACEVAKQYGVLTSDDMYMNKRITDRGFI